MPTTKPRTFLSLTGDANREIDARSEAIPGGLGRSDATDRIVTRYAAMLSAGRRYLPGLFTTNELAFLVDVLGTSSAHEPASIENIDQSVLAAADDYAPLHGVDADDVAAKVIALTELERYALVDAIERYMILVGRGEEIDLRAVLR